MGTHALALVPGLPGKSPETKRQRLDALRVQLKASRQSFESHWKEIADLIRPRRIRLQASDRNRGDKRNQKIVDSTAVFAARTLASGMMSGITSPARQWFKLSLADKTLMERQSVKIWLEDVRERMSRVLDRSNFYEVLSTYYSDLGVFGTTAMIVEEDEAKTIRCTHFALGSYWIGYNEKQQVRVFLREFQMTVRQIVGQFGQRVGDGYSADNLSENVRSAWRNGATEQGIDVAHVIYENPDHDPSKLKSQYKAFASCYFEVGGTTNVFLDEGGYNEWPVPAVRWEVTDGDVYGTDCPGMTALGDIKELMFSKKLGAGALHKAVNPPMVAPAQMKNVATSILPGGVTYFDESADKTYRPAVDTRSFRLDWLQEWVADIRSLIKKAFFEDMFLLISNIEKANTTATEILEKKEEKLLTLGPVGKQVDGGFLDPFFDRLYGIMLRRGDIPEPPPEMEGVTFHPEYETIMAQAQRAQGRSNIEAFSIFVQTVAKEDPTLIDRVDVDEMIKRYSEVTGVPPNFIKSDEAVAAIRKARADAQAKQAAAEQAEMVANSANKLANSPTGDKNALTDLLASGAPGNGLGAAPGPQGGY